MSLRASSTPPGAWDDWLREFPGRTLYHTPAWMEAMCAAYPQYRAAYLADAEGEMLIPYVTYSRRGLRQVLSLPFGTFGGPVYPRRCQDSRLEELLRAFKSKVRGPNVLRYQMALMDPEPRLTAAVERVFGPELIQRYSTYLVPLEKGFDWIWNTGYENDVRRCVRKAEKNGVTLAEETHAQGASVLFELYREQTRAWRIRGHSAAALWRVAETLGNRARIWVTRREGRPLTAVLTLYEPGAEVRPWVSGANAESREVKAYHYMMNGIMRRSCDEGYRVWDWGGSVGRSSVESFKQSMAGRPAPVVQVFKEAGWYRRLRTWAGKRAS